MSKYLTYMALCISVIGWLATGGVASAYHYLLKGIQDFPSAEKLASAFSGVEFEEVSFRRLSLGIAAIHLARKPREHSFEFSSWLNQ